MSSPIASLVRQWKLIFITGLLFGGVSFGVSLLFPLQYRADSQLLIIPRQQYGADPFTVAKSAERIADALSQTVETDAFAGQVMAEDGMGELKAMFDTKDARTRRKAWKRTIEGSAVLGTNLMNLSAYDTSPERAAQLAKATADTIVKSGSDYVGTLIVARVVNEPIATRWPVRPNLLLNALLGFLVGAMWVAWAGVRRQGGSGM